MKKKIGLSALLSSALIMTSVPAHASGKDFAIGALIGVLGAAAAQNSNRKRTTTRRTTRRATGMSAAQRQQNRDVQTALNTFGFPVGTVDGSLGKKSRAAIGDYQTYMGFPRTGKLDEYQRQTLVGGMQRYNAGGGNQYPNVVANEGVRGLLKAFSDPNYANRYRQNDVQQATFGNNNANNNGFGNNNAQNGGQLAGVGGGLAPLDLTFGQAPASMATHCELVAGLTQANQGMMMAGNVSDADQALGEQFCEARTYAMTESQTLMSQLRATDEQMMANCEQIANRMKPATSMAANQSTKAVTETARTAANSMFNNDMQSAATYGKICIGLGYRQDNPEVALGAATALIAAGQTPYAEMMGHHMRWGFGTKAAQQQSKPWYEEALSSMQQGAQPVFVPSKTAERNAIINVAINMQAGGGVQNAQGGGLAPLAPLKLD